MDNKPHNLASNGSFGRSYEYIKPKIVYKTETKIRKKLKLK